MSEEAKERAWKEFDANRPKGSAPVDWNRGYQCGVETGFKGGYDAATADLKTQPTRTAERDALAWPADDIVDKLIEAVDHLLHVHDCDAERHEDYLFALNKAIEYRGNRYQKIMGGICPTPERVLEGK